MPGPRGKPGIPKRARRLWEYIRVHGSAPPGHVGGAPYLNREGRLPAGGSYTEFDVEPHGGGLRGLERLVVDL